MTSRVARKPISIPKTVNVELNETHISLKGPKGTLSHAIPTQVAVKLEETHLHFEPKNGTKEANALSGTTRAVLNNIIVGIQNGYEIKLVLVGVGFRAQVQGQLLNLTLGFSHPVKFDIPEGITIETPVQTEVVIKGIDKHLVGQVAANIRRFRKPERYKGKGIRYSNEVIILKETKKK